MTGVLTIGVTPIKFPTGEDGSLNPDLQIVVNGIEFKINFGGGTGLSFPAVSQGSGVDVSHPFAPSAARPNLRLWTRSRWRGMPAVFP